MTRQKICMVTTNNLDYDTRILNEAEKLAEDFDVLIITTGFKHQDYIKEPKFKVSPVRLSAKIPGWLGRFINLWPIMTTVWQTKTNIYHAHDLPGLVCVWPAAVFKHKFLVYDSHELWSDVALFGLWRIFRWPFRLLERLLISKVNAVITVNDSLAKFLKERYRKPTQAVYNYPKFSEAVQKNSLASYKGKKIILYIGAFRPGRGLKQIVQAAQYLDDSYQILLIGYGGFEKSLRQEIELLHLETKVSILKALPPEELISTIKVAQLGFCLIENVCLSYYYSSPNKLFQYVAAEVPILASNFPEYKEIVLKNGIGETVKEDNPKAIARKIIHMTRPENQKKYRQNLKGLAKEKYNWEMEADKLANFYRVITHKPLNIVVDVNHPAHVHFFKNFIWEAEKKGHRVLITASDKAIAFKLLDHYKFDYIKLGGYGRSFWQKLINVPILDYRLYKATKKFKPDIFIGIGSVRAAHVSKIFRKPSIVFDDSEPASFGQFLYKPFADRIYTPTCFKKRLGKNQVSYDGFHELAYLDKEHFSPDKKRLKFLNLDPSKKLFVMRFVTWKAVHDIGQHGLSEKEKTYLADFLSQKGEVIVSLEKDLPYLIKKNYAANIPPEKMHDILHAAAMLITDSQTMATEAALLGTPVIRCNSFVANNDMGNFIELEKKYDLIYSFPSFDKALAKIKILLKKQNLKSEWRIKAQKLFKDKINVTNLMIDAVEDISLRQK